MNPASVKLSLAVLGATLLVGLTACKQQNAAETLPLPVHTALVQPVADRERRQILSQHRSLRAGEPGVSVRRVCR